MTGYYYSYEPGKAGRVSAPEPSAPESTGNHYSYIPSSGGHVAASAPPAATYCVAPSSSWHYVLISLTHFSRCLLLTRSHRPRNKHTMLPPLSPNIKLQSPPRIHIGMVLPKLRSTSKISISLKLLGLPSQSSWSLTSQSQDSNGGAVRPMEPSP